MCDITIYNTQGVVIRSLQFGHQSAGYYTGRDRAAYWDGQKLCWRTGCEWTVFLSARNRRDVVNAEDGYFEVAVQLSVKQDWRGFRDLQDRRMGDPEWFPYYEREGAV